MPNVKSTKLKSSSGNTRPTTRPKAKLTANKRAAAGTDLAFLGSRRRSAMASMSLCGTSRQRPSRDSFLRPLLTDVGWGQLLSDIFDAHKELDENVEEAYKKAPPQIFPPKDYIFHAFNITPLYQMKVVILGQDPYHDDGQAHGLSFSVPSGMKIPPSLRNIFKELCTDVSGFRSPQHGCLEGWAKQGILLLNATLTVEAHKPNSHSKFGWQVFTDQVIQRLSGHLSGIVFVLWGGFAHKKKKLIDGSKHRIIETAHPSPLSSSKFFGCKCFSEVNKQLVQLGKEPIDWNLSN